jgi:hypothetical protein
MIVFFEGNANLYERTIVAGCLARAGGAIGGLADLLLRSQFFTILGYCDGMNDFRIVFGGGAMEVLGGDLKGVEEQARVARVQARVEVSVGDLRERHLDGGGVIEERERNGIPDGAGECRRLASLPVGFDVTTELIHKDSPPYLAFKMLVFNDLRDRCCRKIVKQKELSAKSSRIRSYGPDSGQSIVLGMLLRMIVRQKGEIIGKWLCCGSGDP